MDWLEAKLEALARDRRHGAVQLAATAIRILMAVCRQGRAATVEELNSKVSNTGRTLAAARPSMAPIRNWSLLFVQRFRQYTALGVSLDKARRQGLLLGRQLLARQQEIRWQQVQAARPLLAPCTAVVTLSYSFTVEAILRHSLPASCRVIIAEARPLMEGRRLFRRLSGGRCELRLITDAQLGLTIPTADLVLVGADAVLSDLGVVNKSGTYLAALVARDRGCEFFVASDTYKINPTADSSNSRLEVKSGREVWRSHGEHCDNVYFDITPGRLVTGFITEEGILPPAEMKKQIRQWQELAKSLAI